MFRRRCRGRPGACRRAAGVGGAESLGSCESCICGRGVVTEALWEVFTMTSILRHIGNERCRLSPAVGNVDGGLEVITSFRFKS